MATAALLVGRRAPADATWGTLGVRSHAAVAEARPAFAPGRLRPLPAATWQGTLSLTHVNMWAQMPGFFYDGEWSRLAVGLARGLGHGTEVHGELALSARSGGFLDGFIMGFHRLFHITQARRDRYPRDTLRVQVAGAAPPAGLAPDDAGVGLANPVIGVRQRLAAGAAWALSADVSLGLPLPGDAAAFASRRPALVVSVAYELAVRWGLGLQAAAGALAAPPGERLWGVPLTPLQPFALGGLRWQVHRRLALLGHTFVQGGVARGLALAPLDRGAYEFVGGLQWRAGTTLWEMALVENSVHDANTPDFGLFVGCRAPLGAAP